MIDITPDWQPVTQDEVAELAPYTLQCQGLSDKQVDVVKREYLDALERGVIAAVRELGRVLEQDEAEKVAQVVVAWFNDHRIPAMREAQGRALH